MFSFSYGRECSPLVLKRNAENVLLWLRRRMFSLCYGGGYTGRMRRMFSFGYGAENVLLWLRRRMFCSPFAMATAEDVLKRNAEENVLFSFRYGGGCTGRMRRRMFSSDSKAECGECSPLATAENVLLMLWRRMQQAEWRRMFSFGYGAENVLLRRRMF